MIDKQVEKQVEKFPIAEAFKLRVTNKLTYQEIADRYNVSPQAIHQRLQSLIRLIGDKEVVEAYTDYRTSILTNIEKELISKLLDKNKLSKATINNIAYAFEKIHTARRLEEDKATSIVKPLVTIQDLKEPIDITPETEQIDQD